MTGEHAFAEALRRDGFAEVLRRDVPPHHALPEHEHGWAVRGLVLAGRFRVTTAAGVQDCGPDEVFALTPGERHEEAAGPAGATLLIGRRRG
jgi:quercetin dioxygenase-like cupin family protein